MGIRGGDNFNLSLILQILVDLNDLAQEAENLIKQNRFIRFAEAMILLNQTQERFIVQLIGVEPGQVEPDLQVTEILFGELVNG